MNKKLQIYCITDKKLDFLEKLPYRLCAVGQNYFDKQYLQCNTLNNIFYKEKYYSELTFHYWYWKNLLDVRSHNWVGFCQKRRFWIKNNSNIIDIDKKNILEHLITEPEDEWNNYESIICNPINIYGAKKIKILKRGWKSIIKNPLFFFGSKKETVKFHFDMHHGHGNLEKAIKNLDINDRDDFDNYVNNSSSFNPHLMCISKPVILNKWFNALFPWLERCEKDFGLEGLEGYDLQRIYAYLAERYHSFWFRKYTKFKESKWIFIDN